VLIVFNEVAAMRLAHLPGCVDRAIEQPFATIFDDLGCVLIAGSPGEFGKLIAEETEKWGKVVRFSGARAD
jgi:hypothetical protein